jgi:large subunit ribosomal protein L32
MRRANHDKITAPNLSACSNCSAPTLPGRICPSCGFYKGRAVVSSKES